MRTRFTCDSIILKTWSLIHASTKLGAAGGLKVGTVHREEDRNRARTRQRVWASGPLDGEGDHLRQASAAGGEQDEAVDAEGDAGTVGQAVGEGGEQVFVDQGRR